MANFTARYPGQGGGGSGGGGVTSLNSETGDLNLTAGTGIAITTPTSTTIQIASTSAGDVTLGAFGSTPNANGLSISGSQVLNMQPADSSQPGGVSVTTQSFQGLKSFVTGLLTADGTNSAPGLSFVSDTDTGLYRLGANDLGFAAGSFLGLEIKKSTGSFSNVGMGSAPSASDNYPLLLQRSNVSSGTYAQISNPDTSASSKATFQLATDLGANTGELSIFTAATTTAAYAGSLVLRPSDSTLRLSLIGGDLAGGYVTTYTAGDYTTAGEALRINADKSIQFMQQISTPATPAASTAKLYQKSDGRLYQKSAAGTERILGTSDTTGTVTSVAMTVPSVLSVSGSPVTGTGTLAVTYSGTALPVANGGTGLTSGTSGGVLAYTASGTLASSGALAQNGVVLGGGAGAVPTTLATSASTVAALISGGTNTAPAWGTLAIGGGGTGQATKAAAFDALSPMSAGGDLIYGGTSGTGTRLPNGSVNQYLASAGTTAAPVWTSFAAPTIQTFTSGTGATYTTPTSPRTPLYLRVRMVGGGGGGSSGGTAGGTAAGDGTASTWKKADDSVTYASAGGGSHGVFDSSAPAAGGTSSLTTVTGTVIPGGKGQGGPRNVLVGSSALNGGCGGNSFYGGGGGGGGYGGTGGAGATNSGGGGGGGGGDTQAGNDGGNGGGSGGFCEFIVTGAVMASTFHYTVGGAGSASGAGTNGGAGGAGAAGYIEVWEYYQ